MKYLFRRNTKTIQEINRDFTEGKLFADPSYQRRKVWNDQDKVRLIETILMELVMPEVFFGQRIEIQIQAWLLHISWMVNKELMLLWTL